MHYSPLSDNDNENDNDNDNDNVNDTVNDNEQPLCVAKRAKKRKNKKLFLLTSLIFTDRIEADIE